MVEENRKEISRRQVLRTAGVAGGAGLIGTGSLPAGVAADPYDDPEYPSDEWFAREQSNWARTREEPIRQANDPGFIQRWQEQSIINAAEYRQQRNEETEWADDGNACRQFSGQCTGNPYLFPESTVLESLSEAVDAEALGSGEEIETALSSDEGVEPTIEQLDITVEDGALDHLTLTSSRTLDGMESETDISPRTAHSNDLTDIETATLPAPDDRLESIGDDSGASLWAGHPFYEEVGDVQRIAFYDSGLDQDEGGARLSGRVWAPKDAEPGDDLPGVVITNGSIQASETLYWWFAHTLVANGYVVMTYDPRGQGRSDNETPDGTEGGNFESSVFVTNQVDAIDLFRSTPQDPYQHNTEDVARDDHDVVPIADFNPFWEILDRDRIGIVGHSLGATGVSVVQGMEWPEMAKGDENPVDVAVAWDNLSEAGSELAGREVVPRVPTMGQGADYFAGVPKTSPPDPHDRNTGFESWREAGVPSFQVNIRGGTHFEWSLVPTFPTTDWESWGNELADHYSLAWFDFWLKETETDRGANSRGGRETATTVPPGPPEGDGSNGGSDAVDRLLAEEPWHDRLSFYYRSAYSFPSDPSADASSETWHVCENMREGC